MTPINLYGEERANHYKEIGLLSREDLHEHFSTEYSLNIHMKLNYSLYYHSRMVVDAASLSKREYNLSYHRADSVSSYIVDAVPATKIIQLAEKLAKHDTVKNRVEMSKIVKELSIKELLI